MELDSYLPVNKRGLYRLLSNIVWEYGEFDLYPISQPLAELDTGRIPEPLLHIGGVTFL